ncbi:ABC transporter ATP-binding protein [Acuticoccus sediminis]|uniref:ABC transporter ATP-binding protein n=1 Tax=Acuticoccus sediminis TaxID=2184697 RepID=A0A8B2NGC9_9HYPH|nr:ABC transporter ATP-binding protein [Acuticoccus sediminis]RAH96814.1 ABC transporter ATP-binding protein [Acuticoccus sediminis]
MLKVQDIHKHFAGLHVLRGVSLEADAGRITGIIGPNGAGKSTLFSVMSGFVKADRGRITLEGRPIDRLRADQIAIAGLVRTFQVPREFTDLSVLDNLRVAASGASHESITAALLRPASRSAEERRVTERAEAMLERLRLNPVAHQSARTLSGGQKKLLELGRALLVEPRVLLVDEPFAGVAPALRDQLLEHLAALREEGVCLLVIEHDIEAIMGVSDTIFVLVDGAVLVSGRPEEVRQDRRVLDAYLGTLPT